MRSATSDPGDQELSALIAAHGDLEGPMLPILHAIQSAYGHLPPRTEALVAEALNLTTAEVHGVITFYHDFRRNPAGRHVIRICRAEACQSVGANALTERVLNRLGIGWGETTRDGAVTVEAVYCLGLCACGPAGMVDGRVVGRLDDAKLDAILAEAGA